MAGFLGDMSFFGKSESTRKFWIHIFITVVCIILCLLKDPSYSYHHLLIPAFWFPFPRSACSPSSHHTSCWWCRPLSRISRLATEWPTTSRSSTPRTCGPRRRRSCWKRSEFTSTAWDSSSSCLRNTWDPTLQVTRRSTFVAIAVRRWCGPRESVFSWWRWSTSSWELSFRSITRTRVSGLEEV